MARNRGQGGPIETRLISLFASLFFGGITGWLSQQSLPYFLHRSFRGVGVAAPEAFSVYSWGCLARYSQGLALVGVVALCITNHSSSLPAWRPSAGRLLRCAPLRRRRLTFSVKYRSQRNTIE